VGFAGPILPIMARSNSTAPRPPEEHPVLRSLREAPIVEPEPDEIEALEAARADDAAHPEERRTLAQVAEELGIKLDDRS
jgi:hypothetical protein